MPPGNERHGRYAKIRPSYENCLSSDFQPRPIQRKANSAKNQGSETQPQKRDLEWSLVRLGGLSAQGVVAAESSFAF